MSNDKTTYKYRIGFHQSLTSGVIGFEGNVNWDSGDSRIGNEEYLMGILKQAENIFREAGYRVASDIEPKQAKPVKNGQSNKEVES